MVGGVAVGAELARADGREVARIEREHHPLAAVVGEPVGAITRCRRARSRARDRRSRSRHARRAYSARPAFASRRRSSTPSIVTDLGRLLGRVAELADRLDDVLALGHLAEHGVVGRQPGVGGRGDDEELAPRGARRLDRGLRHRDEAVRVDRCPPAAARRPCSRGRRCRCPSGRRPGSRSRARSGGRSCRRRSPARRGRRTSSPSSASSRCRARSRSCRSSSRPSRVAGSPCSQHLLGLLELVVLRAAAPRPPGTPRRPRSSTSSGRRRRRRRRRARGRRRASSGRLASGS